MKNSKLIIIVTLISTCLCQYQTYYGVYWKTPVLMPPIEKSTDVNTMNCAQCLVFNGKWDAESEKCSDLPKKNTNPQLKNFINEAFKCPNHESICTTTNTTGKG